MPNTTALALAVTVKPIRRRHPTGDSGASSRHHALAAGEPTEHAADGAVGQWYSAVTSMVPTMFALSAARSSAGIQYSRMVLPPTWWTS